ncbi:hypothetical protein DM860_002259 [Cuscuta australis]|uniref:Peptidase A1 domain-containing protein n=1 Tax=Cuscuta australis TaxID=267555 RepID=A0A328D1I0_9ASTE|nr:hypothetical protein DM860_002259 [Cuscuta australis]
MTMAINLSWMHLCVVVVLAIFGIASRATTAGDVQMTSFNVMGSLRKTLDVFSFSVPEESSFQENTLFSSSSSSLESYSLELHTRLSVGKTVEGAEDYGSLMAARLDRDLARVRWLQTRGAREEEEKEEDEEMNSSSDATTWVPIISGVSQGSGEYFARLKIGSPGREYYLVTDTGSDLTWLQCLPCSSCYKQTDPIFDPRNSSTYSTLPCAAQQCQWLHESGYCSRDRRCMYEIAYGDKSTTAGELATESVALGSAAASQHNYNKVPIGCGHSNKGLFAGASGLLGLSRGPLSLPSQMNVASFSYCLVDRDSTNSSTLEFFAYSTTTTNDSSEGVVVARLIPQEGIFYLVDLIGISVGNNEMIPISAYPSGGGGAVIIDSGTSITRLHKDVYSSFRRDFLNASANLRTAADPNHIFDTCYDFSNEESVQVPTVSFHFTDAGNMLELPAENYLVPMDASGTFCLALFPTSSSISIIGNVQQQGMRVTYDLHNSLIRFKPKQC